MSQVVRSIEACQKMLDPLAQELSMLHPPALNPDQDYSVPWILRSKVILILRQAGIKCLKTKATTTVQDLHKTFPDANDWLRSMVRCEQRPSWSMNEFLATPLKDLMRSLHYKHPPELLTMFFCLFGDSDVLSFPLTWLQQHKMRLRTFRIEYKAKHGVEAHPFILLHAFKRSLEGQGTSKVLKRPAAAL